MLFKVGVSVLPFSEKKYHANMYLAFEIAERGVPSNWRGHIVLVYYILVM